MIGVGALGAFFHIIREEDCPRPCTDIIHCHWFSMRDGCPLMQRIYCFELCRLLCVVCLAILSAAGFCMASDVSRDSIHGPFGKKRSFPVAFSLCVVCRRLKYIFCDCWFAKSHWQFLQDMYSVLHQFHVHLRAALFGVCQLGCLSLVHSVLSGIWHCLSISPFPLSICFWEWN